MLAIAPSETASRPPLIGQFVTVWSRKVHYHTSGSGPAVLLLHGNGSLGEEILSSFARHHGLSWVAPDRPGYGLSEPLDKGHEDPGTMARWALALMDALKLERVTLVAHSIAAGAALCLAARAPRRVGRLVLLAPFCRPTPHRWMLGLRLAVAPVIGKPVRRYVVPALLPLFRRRILEGMLDPNPVPPWLSRFPIEHAARPRSIRTMAAELRRFNEGMCRAERRLNVSVPTTVLFGEADETAPPSWHGPWLARHVKALRVVRLAGVGHAVHHAAPRAALKAIRGKGQT
jgi:pimeloyl-ACP methyl ester carboxylesterase